MHLRNKKVFQMYFKYFFKRMRAAISSVRKNVISIITIEKIYLHSEQSLLVIVATGVFVTDDAIDFDSPFSTSSS